MGLHHNQGGLQDAAGKHSCQAFLLACHWTWDHVSLLSSLPPGTHNNKEQLDHVTASDKTNSYQYLIIIIIIIIAVNYFDSIHLSSTAQVPNEIQRSTVFLLEF